MSVTHPTSATFAAVAKQMHELHDAAAIGPYRERYPYRWKGLP